MDTLVRHELHWTPHHHLGDLGLRGLRWQHLTDDLSATKDADAVGDRQRFLQLVGDEHHTPSGGDQRAHDGEELDDLLGGEHRRGLVEHDHLGVAQQHLHDLDTLLHADRQLLDDCIGIELEGITLGDLPHHRARGVDVERAEPTRRLHAQDHVLGDGEVRNQHEVLVDHADAGRDRIGWRGEHHIATIEADRPAVGSIHPVEDAHQGRLARPVFADQGDDLTGGES